MTGVFTGTTKTTTDGEIHLAEALTDATVVPYTKNGKHQINVEIPLGFTMGSATTITIKDSGTNTLVAIPLTAAQLANISGRNDEAYAKNYIVLN